MDNIVLHLKFVRGMMVVSLVFVIRQHVKVAHILPEFDAYLNLDEKMTASAPTLTQNQTSSKLRIA